jgi:hypothetical protein
MNILIQTNRTAESKQPSIAALRQMLQLLRRVTCLHKAPQHHNGSIPIQGLGDAPLREAESIYVFEFSAAENIARFSITYYRLPVSYFFFVPVLKFSIICAMRFSRVSARFDSSISRTYSF